MHIFLQEENMKMRIPLEHKKQSLPSCVPNKRYLRERFPNKELRLQWKYIYVIQL